MQDPHYAGCPRRKGLHHRHDDDDLRQGRAGHGRRGYRLRYGDCASGRAGDRLCRARRADPPGGPQRPERPRRGAPVQRGDRPFRASLRAQRLARLGAAQHRHARRRQPLHRDRPRRERRAVSCCPLRQPLSRHAGLRVLSGAGTACPAPRRAGAGQRADRRVPRCGTAAGDPLGAQKAGRRARETHPQRSRLCGKELFEDYIDTTSRSALPRSTARRSPT